MSWSLEVFMSFVFLIISIRLSIASFEAELEALENDLSTDELIDELEREIDGKADSAVGKKYRRRFENILLRKFILDELQVEDKLRQRRQSPTSDEHEQHKNSPYCKEKIPAAVCQRLKEQKKCQSKIGGQKERMVRLCPLTCEFCRLPVAPDCAGKDHGCCWDRTTIKHNYKGTNCPPCVDQYRYVCKTFKPDCESHHRPGMFMQRMCPTICGLCEDGRCHDHHSPNKDLCKFWKTDLHWCEEHTDVMTYFCPRTCGFCPPKDK